MKLIFGFKYENMQNCYIFNKIEKFNFFNNFVCSTEKEHLSRYLYGKKTCYAMYALLNLFAANRVIQLM